jgi:NADH:ubiquinone oxidoreductase subunit 3 (subunit A)
MLIMAFVGIAGAATLVVALVARNIWEVAINEQMLGVYAGVGTGLLVGGIVLLIKDALLLRNEERLKNSRLECSDERNEEISNKAVKFTLAVVLFALYGVTLIGGLYYPILVKIMTGMIFLILLSYMGAYQFYKNRM